MVRFQRLAARKGVRQLALIGSVSNCPRASAGLRSKNASLRHWPSPEICLGRVRTVAGAGGDAGGRQEAGETLGEAAGRAATGQAIRCRC